MKRILLLSLFSLSMVCSVVAQDKTVQGKVVGSDDGQPIPGVNVILKGTTNGTTTDFDGNYSLSVPSDGGILVFSFIGLISQEATIGTRTTVDVSMQSDVQELQEVVVTALGISKEKKALGYGVSSIDNEVLVDRQEADVARLLRGKATGVDITQTSGLSGSGTNIIIRGYSTITGTNQPLFVVDGVPFNTETNTGSQSFASGSASASSRFLDLDPNTIEEISILKGLSATVLYGEAGRNGVVLVTTKNGKAGQNASRKAEISVRQGIYVSEIANIPDYQNTYGNGFNAGFGWFFSNWGAAFDDLAPTSYGSDFQGLTADGTQVLITHPLDQAQYNDDVPQFIGAEYVYRPYESVENFFDQGVSSNTSISIESKLGDNSSMSATYSYLTDNGFVPNLANGDRSNYIDKNNFGLGAQTTLNNGLSIRGSFNYVQSERFAPITAPAFGGDGNGLFAAILFTPRSVDLLGLPFQSPIDGSNIYYRRGSPIQNPLWTLNNSGQREEVNRFFSSTQLSYKLTDNLSLMYRLSVDNYNQENRRHVNKGGPRQPLGELTTTNISNRITDQIINVLYNFTLPGEITVDGVVGFNSRREVQELSVLASSNQFVYGVLSHDNFIDHVGLTNFFINGVPIPGFREENTLGLYATASVGFKYALFLNLQARNDWTSTLEQENRSVFYPSASLAFVPTDAITAISNSNVLNYLKVRLGYGRSAGYPNPYRTRSVLNSNTNQFVTSGGTVLNTNSVSNRLGNRNLTAEFFNEIEAGVEARFLDNIIGIDLSLYQKTSEDLIIDLPLDPSTGFTVTTVNAAKIENKGVELGLNITPPLPNGIKWDINLNYTRNVSNVESIFSGIDQVQTAGYSTLGNYAIPGEQFGVFFGESFLKVQDVFDENGNNLTNYGDQVGQFVVDNQGAYQSSGNFEVIGDPNPNFQANWDNSISWKGISFGFQWQYIDGGDIFSSTVQSLLARGNTVDTDVDRNIPLIMPNAVKQTGTDDNGNPVYVDNDIQTYIGDSFFRAYFFADEGGVFDGTTIRLRQVSLGYVLPKTLLEKTPFGTIGVTLSGENLWYNAPNFPEGINFDPEISSLGVGNGRGFDFRTAPTAKKYGVTLNATF